MSDVPSFNLYYFPNTASFSVHWVLVHLEQLDLLSFRTTLLNIKKGDQHDPSYLHLNPKGRIPCLLVESTGHSISESPAILQYLAETFPLYNLAPRPNHPNRIHYLETMVFLSNSLLPALRDRVYAEKDFEGEHPESIRQLGVLRISKVWDILDHQLAGKDYLVGGEEPTVCDYLAVSVTKWFPEFEEEARRRSNVGGLIDRMQKRDDWIEVRKREEEVKKGLEG